MGILYYTILLPLFYFLSILPLRLLYVFSDVLYLFAYYILKYRRRIVLKNLQNAFPEKSDQEIVEISKKFYHYLCDLIVETIKLLTISKKSLIKRCQFKDLSIFDNLYQKNQSFVIVMGHFGNWEWGGASMSAQTKPQLLAIYKVLNNRYIDKLMQHIRTRMGGKAIPMQETLRAMLENKKMVTGTAFIADQVADPRYAFWTSFLNQPTAVYLGAEKIAKKLNYPVIYAAVHKVRRGYYNIDLTLLVSDPKNTHEGYITALHTKMLEKDILKQPHTWLWSHKRWKHKYSAQNQT